ncbi:MAG TPA: dockerin type I domain-containing protein [Patescibacteria group bacterium]|nr:dockerin type I domain-containing protein [Patescibacteria group bacterium]
MSVKSKKSDPIHESFNTSEAKKSLAFNRRLFAGFATIIILLTSVVTINLLLKKQQNIKQEASSTISNSCTFQTADQEISTTNVNIVLVNAQTSVSPTPATTQVATGTIVVNPQTNNVTIGNNFTVNIDVNGNGVAFNAVQADISVSNNLRIVSVQPAAANSCNFAYLSGKSPSTVDPSFVGAILNSSSNSCTAYTMTLAPTSAGIGTITISNGGMTSFSSSSQMFASSADGTYAISSGITPQPSITPILTDTEAPIPTSIPTPTQIIILSPTSSPTPPSGTTDTPTPIAPSPTLASVCLAANHRFGDINNDGIVDEFDLSVLSSDWKQVNTNLTITASDINCDGTVDLSDFSIFAKYWGTRWF